MTDTTEKSDGAVRRPFADFLRDQGKGKLHDELTEKFHDLIAAIAVTGRKGRIQLTLTVEPNKKSPDVLQVSDEVRVVVPQPERRASIFYTDADGNLTGTDPNQLQFEGLREVPAPAPTELKTPKEKKA